MEYQTNIEPKIGDRVTLKSSDKIFTVEQVGLGRLGNKVAVRPEGDNSVGSWREYYFYCLTKV